MIENHIKEQDLDLNSLLNQDLCKCTHSISKEHSLGKCYALDITDNVIKACLCNKVVKLKRFFIRVNIEDLQNAA